MHFSTHQKILIDQVKRSLDLNKVELVAQFKKVLPAAAGLFKIDRYEFWLHTLECVAIDEIPMTVFGHSEAMDMADDLVNQDRNAQAKCIYKICEYLFTYAAENQICNFQTQYHYYCMKDTGAIFKLSDSGMLEGASSMPAHSYRIAYISEVDVQTAELYK